MLPPFYIAPRDVWRYEIVWDDSVHQFSFFGAAKAFLLSELWWLAEDLDSELTFQAWSEVCTWQPEADDWPKSVVAGDPPATYSMVRR